MPLLPILAALLAAGAPAPADTKSIAAVAGHVREAGQVLQLVEAFTRAQHDFDQARLRALTTDDYMEISPIGEVDPRDKMLGFYDPAKKVDGPAMTVSDTTVRMVGRDVSIAVTKISYSLPANDGPRAVAMRAVFVARRDGLTWKLASAQYTPIRAKS
jgi:hypothetical protein